MGLTFAATTRHTPDHRCVRLVATLLCARRHDERDERIGKGEAFAQRVRCISDAMPRMLRPAKEQ